MTQNKTIGLIGGNGSFASAYFYRLLLDKAVRDFGAKNNDDFPHILIDSLPVPDFISDKKNADVSLGMLKESVSGLDKHEPVAIAILCNTIHLLYEDLAPYSSKLISIIDVVCEEVVRRGYKRVGVLATPTTINSDLYGKALRKMGMEPVYPDISLQKYHEQLIRKVIAGDIPGNDLESLTREFIEKNNLDGVILGCTELPLIFPKGKLDNVIDCLDVLANDLLFRYYA